jgi:NADPH:quinone reductase-like Zn-dependent oxidoreductase
VPLAAVLVLPALRDLGRIRTGQKVVIDGALSELGIYAVQIAKAMGTEVTAVCSAEEMELARKLGADCAIDCMQEDFTTNGERYNLILALNGYHPITSYMRSLRPSGAYVALSGSTAQAIEAMLLGPLLSLMSDKQLGTLWMPPGNQEDLTFVAELLEAGKLVPILDRSYPLEQVPEAMRYLGEGHAKGKLVIRVKEEA